MSQPNMPADFYKDLIQQIPGLIVVMDKASKFLYSNQYTAKLFGYKNEETMRGIDAHGMRCPAVECASDFIAQDQLVMETDSVLTVLDIHHYADGNTKILLTKKSPYKNGDEIIGSICHCTEITSNALSQVCASLIKADKKFHSPAKKYERSYAVGRMTSQTNLTTRELDVMFFLLRGMTMKEMSSKLGITPRTVESHLTNIKNKLNCYRKSQLVDYALANGLLNYIPDSIVSNEVSQVLHQSEIAVAAGF